MKQNKLQQPFMLCSFKLPCLRYMGQVMRKLEERNGMAACLLIKLGMESSLVFLLEPNIYMGETGDTNTLVILKYSIIALTLLD